MAKFLSFAMGWKKDNGRISCKASAEKCSMFDPSDKSSEDMKLKLVLENEDGEQLEIEHFYLKELEGGQGKNGKPKPTHQVIVAIED